MSKQLFLEGYEEYLKKYALGTEAQFCPKEEPEITEITISPPKAIIIEYSSLINNQRRIQKMKWYSDYLSYFKIFK